MDGLVAAARPTVRLSTTEASMNEIEVVSEADVDHVSMLDAAAQHMLDNWVMVIAATNRPWAMDPAILRRLTRQIRVCFLSYLVGVADCYA